MGPSFTTWLTYCQFLLINSTSTWSAVMNLSLPFMSTNESIDDTASIWALFPHTGIYIMVIGSLMPAGLGIFCCHFSWCWPARLGYWPLWSGSMWLNIVDDDVEAAPIYRCDGKAGQSIIRPHKNHDLHMEQEPTWMESWQKQQTQSKAVPASRYKFQNPGNVISTCGLLSGLGLDQLQHP